MNPALFVKLRPSTPWRIAPADGARDRVDSVYHSDTLFSAVTLAMQSLGMLETWLEATARAAEPAVRFSSCYPFHQDTLLVAPPRSVWPPPPSTRVRWKAARFVPLKVVETLLDGHARLREDDWVVDGVSECLLPAPRGGRLVGPFRRNLRRQVAVDRLTGTAGTPVTTACLEFSPECGLWFVAVFANEAAREEWRKPLETCLRVLADSGFGAERSLGWGRAATPEFQEATFPGLLLSKPLVQAPAVPPVHAAPMAAAVTAAPAVEAEQAEAPTPVAPVEATVTEAAPSEQAPAEQAQPVEEVQAESAAPVAPLTATITTAVPVEQFVAPVNPDADTPAEVPDPAEAPDTIAPQEATVSDAAPAEPAQPMEEAQAESTAPVVPLAALGAEVPEAAAQAVVEAATEPAPEVAADASIEVSSEPAHVPPADAGSGVGAVAGEVPAEQAPEEVFAGNRSADGFQPVDATSAETAVLKSEPSDDPVPEGLQEATQAAEPAAEAVPVPPVAEMAYWLLSVFCPGSHDVVDWTRGAYALLDRAGRVDSAAAKGDAKKSLQMVSEGSVVFAGPVLDGGVVDVAPDGFAHPVYRSGVALAIPIPWKVVA